MRHYQDIGKDDLQDLLGKGWLTHDGTWFLSAAGQLGMETANRLNKSAIRLLAPLEMRRSRGLLLAENEELEDLPAVIEFLFESLHTVMPPSITSRFHVHHSSTGIIRWEWDQGECFAYRGMRQLGFIDEYHCGVIYRIECWLEALGMVCETSPPITKCIMHTTGTCSGEFRISFPTHERNDP
jgi:hypothetical protein